MDVYLKTENSINDMPVLIEITHMTAIVICWQFTYSVYYVKKPIYCLKNVNVSISDYRWNSEDIGSIIVCRNEMVNIIIKIGNQ